MLYLPCIYLIETEDEIQMPGKEDTQNYKH